MYHHFKCFSSNAASDFVHVSKWIEWGPNNSIDVFIHPHMTIKNNSKICYKIWCWDDLISNSKGSNNRWVSMHGTHNLYLCLAIILTHKVSNKPLTYILDERWMLSFSTPASEGSKITYYWLPAVRWQYVNFCFTSPVYVLHNVIVFIA